jgi:hypothetical protein
MLFHTKRYERVNAGGAAGGDVTREKRDSGEDCCYHE